MESEKIQGLTSEEVMAARNVYGSNSFNHQQQNGFLDVLKGLLKEPMVILLFVASAIYFVNGSVGDGVFLAIAIVLISVISLYQDSRSRNALAQLKKLTEPDCKVIRNGVTIQVKSEELVFGDYMVVEEGTFIAADGEIVQSNDFSVNESILTGESMSVYKDRSLADHQVYSGTTVSSGLAIVKVTAIGNETKLGKIAESLEQIKEEKTPLEIQISNFVKKMVFAGAVIFAIVWAINYYNSGNGLDSLMKALTIAMSVLPEEIPVAFTTFMALGAWRLMKMGIVVKQMKTVETLGSATVICTDKTGTITENKMSLAGLYTIEDGKISKLENELSLAEKMLVRTAMWASEPIPFDPMEIALHEAYSTITPLDERPQYKMRHEYPLGGKPPMMTHIFQNQQGDRVVAAKGAPEALLRVSDLDEDQKRSVETAVKELADQGYRILGVGEAIFTTDNFPKKQQDFDFSFKGLVAFYDPPKKNISAVFESFYTAGIKVKIVTGDNALTTCAIARQVGFRGAENSISGDELMRLTDSELKQRVTDTSIFTRMFPEAKLKIINALKENNEIVAMTGDGVNDGPALKAAHIGIAMGKKGTEIAKQAASLVLVADDLEKMVIAVGMGRRIYANLKKAIQYIISIHIPIILTVFIPLALGWIYPNIFSPVHIIFLELIMGPTCSIIYENEPMEKNTMLQKPRPFTSTFFNAKELMTSVVQGVMITVGTLLTYQYAVFHDLGENTTRTMVFTVLISANIFLTLINRSFYYSILATLKYKNNLVLGIILITIAICGLLIYNGFLSAFFEFQSLSMAQLGVSTGMGFLSVIWYELMKWRKRKMV
ncbi:cation-translocating P-type ATPase [Pedobacter gandavensis]|uniref:cation-translocating P-type ATPase n=1 Tax=Pedobacter gandavensis TaxID=2679963 RepID=UPI0024799383|nr:cation-translocating P-type ATPase [Pedobacter gandavensis]WGQ09846.1 cation-translocating P-type ATPase [Pedobacter gandavensis]